jgi:hypothetical protein
MKQLYILIAILTIASLVAACGANPNESLAIDETSIYAAVVREVYTVDHSFQVSPEWPLVYIYRTTNDQEGDPDVPYSESKRISENVQSNLGANLEDLPAEFIWIDDQNEALVDPDTGLVNGGEGITLTLGNIHMQEDGSAMVSFWLHCGNLCGLGKTYILEQVEGEWMVTGQTGIEIMS